MWWRKLLGLTVPEPSAEWRAASKLVAIPQGADVQIKRREIKSGHERIIIDVFVPYWRRDSRPVFRNDAVTRRSHCG